jgi:hypothetical protein
MKFGISYMIKLFMMTKKINKQIGITSNIHLI